MSKNITEDRWKRRYEKLECRMNEMLAKKDEKLAKKDEKIAQLEEKVNRLEGLFTNAINQIKALTLELNSAKEAAAAANARNISAKTGKKKGNKKPRKSKSKHKRTGRKCPTDIDEETIADATVCDACGGNCFSEVLDEYGRVIIDIQQVKAKITKIVVKRRRCTDCKKLVSGKTALALPHSRFGINFMMMVTALKLHGMSNLRIREIVAMIYTISITESAINRMVLRMARELGPLYEQIRKEVRQSPTCNGDESSWRVDGANHWLWVVVTKYAALYHIDKTRNATVPKKMLGSEYEGVVGSDSWGAWNHSGGMHQKCHIHYVRDIKDTVKYHSPSSEYEKHARTFRRILKDSYITAAPGGKKALAAKKKLDRRIHNLINRLKGETDKHCKRMLKRLRREKDHLFTFLEVKGVEWHNNSAERGIRPCVILRNNSYGSRSEEGASAIAVLMSVKQTCKAKNDNFLDVMRTHVAKTCQKTT